MPQAADRTRAFIRHLEALAEHEDRAALAALRRGLGKSPGTEPEMHRYVVPWLREGSREQEDAPYYMVAALFALWHQGRSLVGRFEASLGGSLRTLAKKTPGAEGAIERRLIGLLACHREDLPERLRHAVSLLRVHEVPVNWEALLDGAARWDHPDRIVQRRWARDFWSAGSALEAVTAGQSDHQHHTAE
jgi:CRISPR system Cascade subunit CasB